MSEFNQYGNRCNNINKEINNNIYLQQIEQETWEYIILYIYLEQLKKEILFQLKEYIIKVEGLDKIACKILQIIVDNTSTICVIEVLKSTNNV